MVAYQKSDVGQKALAVLPGLMQEAMAATLPIIQPAILQIVQETFGEAQALR
jgi:hypothetical protein